MNFCRGLVLLLLVQSSIALADSADTGRIGIGRYVAGGLVGTTLGFGIGHSLQERYWRDYGWAFTIGGIITGLYALFPEGIMSNPCEDEACHAENNRKVNRALMWWLGFKAVETVAVWWPRNVNFEGIYAKRHEVDSRFIPISKTKYLQGGFLGTLVGFGTGHAIQGRWQREGWQHTAWQAGAVALASYGWFCRNFSASGPSKYPGPGKLPEDKPNYPACDAYGLMLLVGIPLFAALKIAEIASVWDPSPDLYRVISDNNQLPTFTVAPLLNTNQAGVQLVLRI